MPFPGERKVRFTEAGRARLDRAVRQYTEQIEALLLERNFIPGEPFVEATASDVEAATQRLVIVGRTGSPFRRLLLRLYGVVGLAMVGAGLFWSQIKDTLARDPNQFMLIAGGLAILLFSALMTTYFDTRAESMRREFGLTSELERQIVRQMRRREAVRRSRAQGTDVVVSPKTIDSPSSQEPQSL